MIKLRIIIATVIIILIAVSSAAAQTGDIQITCETGVRIWLDKDFKGETTQEENGMFIEDLAAGEYRVKAEKSGFESINRVVKVNQDMTTEVKILFDAPAMRVEDLIPAEDATMVQKVGTLFLRSVPLHATIYLNGEEIGETDKKISFVPIGEHKIKFIFKDQVLEDTIEVEQNTTLRLKAHFRKKKIITKKTKMVSDDFTNTVGMKFVKIPAGSFKMGSRQNEPDRDKNEALHKVNLTKSFYIQITEVTQGQWKAVMGNNPSYFSDCGDNCPVENVSWNDIMEFIRKLNQREGSENYRLPTEAEWEYACRAGTETPFTYGECLHSVDANYRGTYPLIGCSKGKYRLKTLPVASLTPNTWGLYDMHGNVSEWCQDIFDNFTEGERSDPIGPSSGTRRVRRGGGWNDYARYCRAAYRGRLDPKIRDNNLGFRLVYKP